MSTTALATSFKSEILQAGHNFQTTVTRNATSGNGTTTLTGLASTAGLAVGMAIAGTNITGGSVIASIDSASQVTMSKASGGSPGTNSTTFTGDVFKLLLVKSGSARSYDGTQTNIGTPGSGTPSASNVGTDEVAASGSYVSGGIALTNVGPVSTNPTTSAAVSFSGSIQWTGATLSVSAAIIYNTSQRLGDAATPLNNRAVSVHDFGGTQSVTSGTLTLTPPTQDGTTGLIRIT